MPLYALGSVEPTIHPDAYIHPDAVIIGDVHIGALSSVWPGAVLRGDDGAIYVGERTSIQDGSIVHTMPHRPTTIGSECTIGHKVHLEGCIIDDRALVGSGSVVLHEAHVGREALVGAQALVPNRKVVPPLSRALGVPCVIEEGVVEPGWFEYGIQSYVDRCIRYRRELRRLD